MKFTCLVSATAAWLLAMLNASCTEPLAPSFGPDAQPYFSIRRSAARTADFPYLQPSVAAVVFVRVFQTLHDTYALPFLFVVTSRQEWIDFHARLLAQNGFVAIPPPPPPQGVNFENGDAVLIFGVSSRAAAYPVQIDQLARRGSHLLAHFTIDWNQRLDGISYSATDMVKFQKWPGLKGTWAIGAEEVMATIQDMAHQWVCHARRPGRRGKWSSGEDTQPLSREALL